MSDRDKGSIQIYLTLSGAEKNMFTQIKEKVLEDSSLSINIRDTQIIKGIIREYFEYFHKIDIKKIIERNEDFKKEVDQALKKANER